MHFHRLIVALPFLLAACGSPLVDPSRFTVNFEPNGGTPVTPQTVAKGSWLTEPPTPIKANFSFNGWYRDVSLLSRWNFSSDRVEANLTLHASWVSTYTVTFDSNGGSPVSAVTASSGARIQEPFPPALTGFYFVGWHRTEFPYGRWDFDTDTVHANLTLMAYWSVGDFSVWFDSTGGTGVPALKVMKGTKITPPGEPTRVGHVFTGWYREPATSTAWGFASDTVNADLTLYAGWAKRSYVVTFDANGGEGDSTQMVLYQNMLSVAPTPTRTNYEFIGWYRHPETPSWWDFGADVVTEDLTLYAHWLTTLGTGGVSVTDPSSIVMELNGVPPIMQNSDSLYVWTTPFSENTEYGWYLDGEKQPETDSYFSRGWLPIGHHSLMATALVQGVLYSVSAEILVQ